MMDKELRRLNRQELLELLIEQAKEIDRLQQTLEETEAKAQNRDIDIQDAGSIASAALTLNNVFESADCAAKQYLENVKRKCEQQQAEYDRIIGEAKAKADEIIAEAEEEKNRQLKIAADYWQHVSKQLDDFYEKNRQVREQPEDKPAKRKK